METNRFEKYIARKLKEREIYPSADAWDRIAEKLETSPELKKKRYFWYGIAAGFVGLLLVSIFFLKKDDTLEDSKIKIVNTPNGNIQLENKEKEAIIDKKGSLTLEGNKGNLDISNGKKNPIVKRLDLAKPDLDKNFGVDTNISQQAREVLEDKDLDSKQEAIMDEKIAEVLARVNLLETADKSSLSDIEVDSLLRNAQRELLADRIFIGKGSVDATVLLNEVEEELDQTFRSQIFETLKNGFLRARTAVADRNN